MKSVGTSEKLQCRARKNKKKKKREQNKMSVKVLICLSVCAFALADDFIIQESTKKFVDECLEENNLSEDMLREYAQQNPTTATSEIKDFFYCVTRKLGTFDGISWDMEKIKTIVTDEDKLKEVEDCLKKDDKTSEPRDRNFAVVMCCMEKEAFL